MPVSLADLEARRANIQSQIARLDDMRAGSITVAVAATPIVTAIGPVNPAMARTIG